MDKALLSQTVGTIVINYPQIIPHLTDSVFAVMTVDYFNAMGIPVKNGRTFTAQDARPGARVVIVNDYYRPDLYGRDAKVAAALEGRGGSAAAGPG